MRAHTDEDIICKALAEEKDQRNIKDNKLDVVVDLDDENGNAHTYVVTLKKDDQNWFPVEISELSAW